MNTIVEPGAIEPPKGEIPFLFLPRRNDLFAARARRLQDLATNHALGDYLRLMGQLAQAQQVAWDNLAPLPVPSQTYLDQCRMEQLPPFGVLGWRRERAWRDGLQMILAIMAAAGPPQAPNLAIVRLGQTSADDLEKFATGLLSHDLAAVPAAVAPFVAAALQVYWLALVSAFPTPPNLPRLAQTNLCPVCGSPPVAGVVKSGGAENGLRYLCCSLCASQWHMVRGICSNCDATQGLTYFTIEGQSGLVTAESCAECHTYLKIIKLGKDPQAEPVSDDLAMLALDLLMDQSGQARNGANLLFHPGNG